MIAKSLFDPFPTMRALESAELEPMTISKPNRKR